MKKKEIINHRETQESVINLNGESGQLSSPGIPERTFQTAFAENKLSSAIIGEVMGGRC